MQEKIYNLDIIHSHERNQVPFSSLNNGIPKNEDATFKKGLGKVEQTIFPNIIVRIKEGINKMLMINIIIYLNLILILLV